MISITTVYTVHHEYPADIHGVYCTHGGGFGSRNLRIAHFMQHHVGQFVMNTTSLELIQSRFPGEGHKGRCSSDLTLYF